MTRRTPTSGSIPSRLRAGRSAAKLLPVASELRLDAERAITLLAQARAAAKLENQEALDAMELGARRIDFIGLQVSVCRSIA